MTTEREKANEYARQWRERNPEKARAADRRWRKNNPAAIRERNRRVSLERRGLTPEDYEAMFAAQDGACAICRTPAIELPRALDVDHCHTTEFVRGLLCNACNRGLAAFRDNPAVLQEAIDYLSRADAEILRDAA